MTTSQEVLWVTLLFTRKNDKNSPWNYGFAFYPFLDWELEGSDIISELYAFSHAFPQMWDIDTECQPGSSYERLTDDFIRSTLSLPDKFDIYALYSHPNCLFFDFQKKMIMDKYHHLIVPPRKRPSHSSKVGMWLSGADRYSKGPEGETDGDSGLEFI